MSHVLLELSSRPPVISSLVLATVLEFALLWRFSSVTLWLAIVAIVGTKASEVVFIGAQVAFPAMWNWGSRDPNILVLFLIWSVLLGTILKVLLWGPVLLCRAQAPRLPHGLGRMLGHVTSIHMLPFAVSACLYHVMILWT